MDRYSSRARELRARRAALRRRRARRRAGLAASGPIALAAALALALNTGSSAPGTRRHRRSAVAGSPSVGFASRRRAGQTRAIDRLLAFTPYVERAGPRSREVALTFDDGPGAATPRILAILRRTRTPATFFVTGRSARAHPGLVAEETRDGFVVGDHTETHPFLGSLPAAAQAAQLDTAAADIHRAGAPYPRLFRPPFGSFDQTTLGLLRARRMLMVLWSADTKDYSRPGVRKIVYAGISGGQPGAVVLMHDGGPNRGQTVAALPRIILRLRQRGYRLVAIPQLVRDDPPPLHQPPPRPLSGLP
jgi:peptidoglycan/xylan/chitin deacetylase (PgdA/CDA1 family)